MAFKDHVEKKKKQFLKALLILPVFLILLVLYALETELLDWPNSTCMGLLILV